MVKMDISGKVALITGGGGDIGGACCEVFADGGAKVAVTDITQERIDNTVAKINAKHPGMAKGYFLDVTCQENVDQVFAAVAEDLGEVDILVCGHGYGGEDTNFFKAELSDARKIYEVNIMGTQMCIKAAAKHMLPKKAGKIVIVSSIAGRLGAQSLVNYSGSKFALNALTQSCAGIMAKDNINVNAICPGFLRTQMWEVGLERFSEAWKITKDEAWQKLALDKIPLGREQKCEDIANLALFLASPFGANITGQAINVDGGVRMN